MSDELFAAFLHDHADQMDELRARVDRARAVNVEVMQQTKDPCEIAGRLGQGGRRIRARRDRHTDDQLPEIARELEQVRQRLSRLKDECDNPPVKRVKRSTS